MKKIIIILLLISLISCTLYQNRKENLLDKELTLITDTAPLENQNIPYIVIKADGRIFGSSGCNKVLGQAHFGEAGDIIFKQLATSKMLCNQDDNIEIKFLEALNKTLHYNIEENIVYLLDSNNKVLISLSIK
jgi:heat shock protein HslJ